MQNIKKYFFYTIFIFLLNSFLFSQDNKTIIKIKLEFADNTKFNNKIILNDLTADVNKYIKAYDSTSDLLESGNFIYLKDQIDRINKMKIEFKDILIKEFENNLNKNKYDFDILPFEDESVSDSFILIITINDYKEGEYNLIRNTPTIVKLSCNLLKNDLNNKSIVKFLKIFKKNASIESPVENIRFKYISNDLSLFILNKLKYKTVFNKQNDDILKKEEDKKNKKNKKKDNNETKE